MGNQNVKRSIREPRSSKVTTAFPKRFEKKERPPGVRGRPVGLRVPPELFEFIEARKGDGYKITETVLRLLAMAKDMVEEVGFDWSAVEEVAQTEKISAGRAAGRLIREAIAARRKQ